MRKGLCSWCRVGFVPDNCSATVLKRMSGFCKACAKKYSQGLYKKNPDEYKTRATHWAATYPGRRKEIVKKHQDSWPEGKRKEYHKRAAGYHRKKMFGTGQEEFDANFESQNGLCAICKQRMVRGNRSPRRACQDHNHVTNKLRDILCSNCNLLIGSCSENIEILANAIQYLRKHRGGSTTQTNLVGIAETSSVTPKSSSFGTIISSDGYNQEET